MFVYGTMLVPNVCIWYHAGTQCLYMVPCWYLMFVYGTMLVPNVYGTMLVPNVCMVPCWYLMFVYGTMLVPNVCIWYHAGT